MGVGATVGVGTVVGTGVAVESGSVVGEVIGFGSGVCVGVGAGDDVGGTEVAVTTGPGISLAVRSGPQAERESVASATMVATVRTRRSTLFTTR